MAWNDALDLFIKVGIGGLISVVTVYVSKLLEMKQATKEHRHLLERVYFERKLAVAENAISHLQIYSSSLNSMAVLLEKFSEEDAKGWEVFDIFSKQLSARLMLLEEAMSATASLYLYFDFDDGKNSNERTFYDAMGATFDLKLDLSVLNDVEKEFPDNDEFVKDYVTKEREAVLERMRLKMKELAEMFGTSSVRLKAATKQIRLEMRDFDIR